MAELASTTIYGNLYVKGGGIICESNSVYSSEDEYEASLKNNSTEEAEEIEETTSSDEEKEEAEQQIGFTDSHVKVEKNGIYIETPAAINIKGKTLSLASSSGEIDFVKNSSNESLKLVFPENSVADNLIVGEAKKFNTKVPVKISDGIYEYTISDIFNANNSSSHTSEKISSATNFNPKYLPLSATNDSFYFIDINPRFSSTKKNNGGIVLQKMGNEGTIIYFPNTYLKDDFKNENFIIGKHKDYGGIGKLFKWDYKSNVFHIDTPTTIKIDCKANNFYLDGKSLESYFNSYALKTTTINGHKLNSNINLVPRDLFSIKTGKAGNKFDKNFLSITYGSSKKKYALSEGQWNKMVAWVNNKAFSEAFFKLCVERHAKSIQGKHYKSKDEATKAINGAFSGLGFK